QIAAGCHERQERGQIAITDERLARLPNLGLVEQRQDLRAAVAAAYADDSGDARIPERLADAFRTDGWRPGHIALTLEQGLVIDRLECQPPDLGDSQLEFLADEGAG